MVSPETITEALSLLCRGLSSRKIADHMHSQRKSEDEKTPSHNTISVWIRIFLSRMAEYVSSGRHPCRRSGAWTTFT